MTLDGERPVSWDRNILNVRWHNSGDKVYILISTLIGNTKIYDQKWIWIFVSFSTAYSKNAYLQLLQRSFLCCFIWIAWEKLPILDNFDIIVIQK